MMFNLLKAMTLHGYQAIPNPLTTDIHNSFPGIPSISQDADLTQIAEICPVGAISRKGIDMGECIFCGMCERVYPQSITFTNDFRMAADERQKLIVQPGSKSYIESSITKRLPRQFSKSLSIRNVSAGGCNACELELGASNNVNFDISRYGIEIVASPRHADVLLVTGPITKNMVYALQNTWNAISMPKWVVLCGSCAISGGIFKESEQIDRGFLEEIVPVLYIPGCPAHPLSIIYGLVSLMRGL